LSNLKQTKFNYITTPNVELIDALYISLAVPIVFAPLYVNEDLYLDGGIIVGCPINLCIADKECNNDEIFCFMNDKMHPIDLSNSFYNKYSENTKANNVISKEANFFEYIFFLIKKLFVKISNVENDIVTYIKNHINTALSYNSIDISYWFQVMSCEKERCHLVNLGKIQATNFLNKLEEDAVKEDGLKETRCDEQITTLVNQEAEAEAEATISISISISNQEKEEGTGEAEPNTSSLANQEEERETVSKSSF
jgi:predicted acylesterase/phospholipase RssA